MNNRLLNINTLDHPTNRSVTVFFFTREEHSDYFKALLSANNLAYEFETDVEEQKYYFGISNWELKKARRLNYLVFAKFRQRFIPNVFARYLLISVTLLFIILAVIGSLQE